MPRYRLTQQAYINNQLHQIDDVVETDGVPGPHMEPAVDEKGKEDKDARAAKDKAAKDQRPVPGDPDYIGDMVAHAMDGGATNGRVNVSSSQVTVPGHPQPAPGLVVDESGQVRGVKG